MLVVVIITQLLYILNYSSSPPNQILNSLTKMSDVPPVIVEILSHLPVKSLLRFRSVSKSWQALIDSRYFLNLHLNQSKKINRIFTVPRGLNHSSFSLCVDSPPYADKLVTPFDRIGFFDQVLGSCNGLIFLSRGTVHREILFWNPSTRNYELIWTIPIPYPPDSENRFTVDRVGYDDVNRDYKVVRWSQYSGSNSNLVSSQIIVYSLKLNSWTSLVREFPYRICEQKDQRSHTGSCNGSLSNGVFVCGSIHWAVTDSPTLDMNNLIVAFDLAKNCFELVPQPNYSDKYVAIDLGILGGCLCVVGNHEKYCVDVWVMGTYGVKESWKKLVAFTMSDVMSVLPSVKPIFYWKNGKEVVFEVDHEWFVRYDLEKKTYVRNKFPNASQLTTCVYYESLV